MNYDELVNLIVKEVYKRLQESTKGNEIKLKKQAVVLWGNNEECLKLSDSEYEFVLYNESVKDCDIVIVSKLCLRGLSNLASGISVSNEERFILKMLMEGKKVYVISKGLEYKKYRKTAPKALYNKYIEFEEEIKKFGIQVIDDKKDIFSNNTSIMSDKEFKIKENINFTEKDTIDLTNKKLISEADLRKPKINGMKVLLIRKNSIVTPLASDFIRINRLVVKRV